MSRTYRIAVLPGDGIGPEVAAQAVKVLRAAASAFGFSLEVEEATVGGAAIDAYGTPLREEDLDRCRSCDAALLGAVGGPRWDDPASAVRPEQGLLRLRVGLGVYANLRPVRVTPRMAAGSPLREEIVQGTDLLVVRELTGGIYFGQPSRRWTEDGSRKAVDTMPYTEEEISRVARMAFELARQRRRHVTSVDKANVLSTSRLWREVVTEVAAVYPDVTTEHMLVDSMAMQLIRDPRRFDVIVTENMFGDILTDEAAMLTGSIGLLPSASLGPEGTDGRRVGLYEPIHGSAPDIAGRGIANPAAAVLSAAMLLRSSLGEEEAAAAVETAVQRALDEGKATADVADEGESLSTDEMGGVIAAYVTDTQRSPAWE